MVTAQAGSSRPPTIVRRRPRGAVILLWLLPVVVVLADMSPMLFTSRSFASDWVNNLWLVREQSLNIQALGHPSFFLTSSIGVFEPEFAFFGSPAFTGTAYLSLLLGDHPLAAYILAFMLSVIAAYVGCWWAALQLGLRGWLAHLPAVLFVTSSFYVTNLYGIADFPQAVATSAVPLVGAS